MLIERSEPNLQADLSLENAGRVLLRVIARAQRLLAGCLDFDLLKNSLGPVLTLTSVMTVHGYERS
jgi:hypothetical protein